MTEREQEQWGSGVSQAKRAASFQEETVACQ